MVGFMVFGWFNIFQGRSFLVVYEFLCLNGQILVHEHISVQNCCRAMMWPIKLVRKTAKIHENRFNMFRTTNLEMKSINLQKWVWATISNPSWAPETQSEETLTTFQNVPAWAVSWPYPILSLAGSRPAWPSDNDDDDGDDDDGEKCWENQVSRNFRE